VRDELGEKLLAGLSAPVSVTPLPDAGSAALARHALLVGMTPLIPLPFLDDLARVALRRRMVRALAAEEGVAVDAVVIEALAAEPGGGCLGFVPRLLLYPIKKVFRKIFFFLEVKRAIDLVSTSWHYGWLLQIALRDRRLLEDAARAAAVRAEIEALLAETSVKPFERVLREALRGSRAIMKGGADVLARTLRGAPRSADRVDEAVASALPREQELLAGLVARVQAAAASAPREHLDRLGAELSSRLTALG
jgi:hypothetical protein